MVEQGVARLIHLELWLDDEVVEVELYIAAKCHYHIIR